MSPMLTPYLPTWIRLLLFSCASVPCLPAKVMIENPTRRPCSRSSRVKKPVRGLSRRGMSFSITVDFQHRGGPVSKMFLAFTVFPRCFRLFKDAPLVGEGQEFM